MAVALVKSLEFFNFQRFFLFFFLFLGYYKDITIFF